MSKLRKWERVDARAEAGAMNHRHNPDAYSERSETLLLTACRESFQIQNGPPKFKMDQHAHNLNGMLGVMAASANTAGPLEFN